MIGSMGADLCAETVNDRHKLQQFNRRKRCIDIAFVLATSPITLPLGLAVATLLRLTQGAPILFEQERLGYLGHPFKMLKFRTMTNNRNAAGMLYSDRDRLTRVGTALRKTSLDELPQLVNVIRGDMSLVGPRPLFTRYEPYYTDRESTRHLVRPGITGYAQISGRNSVRWDARLDRDAQYVERASLSLDLVILVRTLQRVVQRKDVSVVAGDSGKPLDVYRTYPRDGELMMRELHVDDLPTRVEWMNDPETRRYMRLPDRVTMESTSTWFQKKKRGDKMDFVVVDVNANRVIAMMGLRPRRAGDAESYIFVDPQMRGNGFGSRAQRLLLEWAFRHANLEHVISSVSRANTSSYRVHAKFGGRVSHVETDRDEIIVSRDEYLESLLATNKGSQ